MKIAKTLMTVHTHTHTHTHNILKKRGVEHDTSTY